MARPGRMTTERAKDFKGCLLYTSSVTVDGIDVRNMPQAQLHDLLGYVPQKGVLFSGTIDSNLKFGGEHITDADVKKAAAIAQATEFIDAKPQGYQSPIAQGGSNAVSYTHLDVYKRQDELRPHIPCVCAGLFTGDADYYTVPPGNCQPQICIFCKKVGNPPVCIQKASLLRASPVSSFKFAMTYTKKIDLLSLL